ncbi:hypothetical protein TNCV_117671 [Trichonephila clavipes]|nr:hypothetical protein TNCV_117671 [Trichonephila clavipes]
MYVKYDDAHSSFRWWGSYESGVPSSIPPSSSRLRQDYFKYSSSQKSSRDVEDSERLLGDSRSTSMLSEHFVSQEAEKNLRPGLWCISGLAGPREDAF